MKTQSHSDAQHRINIMLSSLLIGVLFIALMSTILPAPESLGKLSLGGIFFGKEAEGAPRDIYPLTIQNLMWIVFFVGLGELWIRLRSGSAETRLLSWRLLPEDEATMLRTKDLPPLYSKLSQQADTRHLFLPRLLQRVILQFQTSRSIDQANSLLNSSLELIQHEIDLRYNLIRYIVWLIPSIGFMGTVIGMAFALSDAVNMPDMSDTGKVQEWLGALTSSLGVAFYTTLVALIMSAILMFLMHIAQGREETALNHSGQYCLDNLINRLYED